LTVLDLLAGIGLLVAAAALRRSPKLGGLMLAAGLLWFLGNLVTPLVFAHRGPLTGAMLIYPATSRLPRSRLSAATIVISCVLSTIYPLGRLAVVTITVWVLVLLCAWFDRPRGSAGHRSQRIGTWCAALLWGSLGVEALLRTWGAADDRALLAVYEIVVLAVCVALICDEWYRHWQPASLAELAVDLGERGPRSLREALGTALGDPEIRIGLGSGDLLVDELGSPVMLVAGRGRVVTPLAAGQRRLGAIEHDAAVRLDPGRLDHVVSLIDTALSNAWMQVEISDQIAQVAASRLRLITIADTERRALASRIESSVAARLERAGALIRQLNDPGELIGRVDDARQKVDNFARGVHPGQLADHGLATALADLARSATQPTTVTVHAGRLPAQIETAVYLVAAEALANVAKHSHAGTASVTVQVKDQRLLLTVRDDGVGGAVERAGGGLAGIRDRLDAVGGELVIDSLPTGTYLRATVPIRPRSE
jgi:signal transduction histidine kinase